jgi:transposase-like protein
MELPLPANALEFDRTYATNEACQQTLLRARWPDGFRCPACGHDRGYELRCRRAVVQCAACKSQISLTAGTIFHGSKLPLRTLFRIVYMTVAEKSGTNALAISRQTGVSHPTALLWVRKVRSVMALRRRERLSGTVEVDESILGGKTSEQKGRRLAKNQAWIVILAEDKGDDGMGRVRLETVEGTTEKVLGAVVQKHVQEGSELRTDAWNSYRSLARKGYSHDPRNITASGRPAHEQLPLVHLVASLLKRYVGGILHGSWRRQWLPWLLAEFEFRFNRRRSRRRPLLFNRVMELALGTRPPTRDAMTEFASLATCASL